MGEKSNKQTARESQNLCQPAVEQKDSLLGQSVGKSANRGAYAKIRLDVLDILNALPFYVLLLDKDHYILEANNAVYTYLGVKREDILGKYCPMVIHGLEHPFDGCPLEEAAEKNQAIERELFDPRSGRWITSAIYPTTALSQDGKIIFFHMVTDITERKQAEEQLRNLSTRLESMREEEKKKIARDLHDETTQLLTSLTAYLEAAVETLPAEADETRALLRKAQALCVNIFDELHRLINELRPSSLDGFGLMAAIHSLVDSHLKTAGVNVNFKTTGKARRLPPSLEIALFRVIQEALNNIARHAHANTADVSVQFRKNGIKVSIKDDGIGFNFQEATSSKDGLRGLGLLGMRERVELMNGSLVIKSSPGHGTEITIEVPLTGVVGDE
jgi:PAS domain S-box-containing protein